MPAPSPPRAARPAATAARSRRRATRSRSRRAPLVTASATNGKAGKWTLDPTDLNIDSTLAASVQGSLNAGTDVSLSTSSGTGGNGDITLSSSINATGSGSLELTGRHLSETGSSTISTGGALVLDVNVVSTEG